MKLEVGKTYLNCMGIKVTIVACKEGRYLGITEKATDDGPVFAADGIRKGQYPHDRSKDLIKEYKELVTYTQVVAWVVHRGNQAYNPIHSPFIVGYKTEESLREWADKYGYTILKFWTETFTDEVP